MGKGSLETLSALFDDEAEELELRRLLRELEREDPVTTPLRGHWQRLHFVRASLRGDAVFNAPHFLDRVNAALDEAPVPAAPGKWRRAVGSLAVAASVAAAVLTGGQQLIVTERVEGSRVASLPVGVVNTTGAVPVQASFGTRDVPVLQPADRTAYRELARQRMRRYSQEHAEHASLNTPQGLLPFARVPVIER